jgi:hypothetical protein
MIDEFGIFAQSNGGYPVAFLQKEITKMLPDKTQSARDEVIHVNMPPSFIAIQCLFIAAISQYGINSILDSMTLYFDVRTDGSRTRFLKIPLQRCACQNTWITPF